MLLLTTKESVILFDQKYYSQIDGEAMDSLLGPTLANIFLCYHESTWLKTVRKLSNHYIAKGTLITSFRCLKNQNKFHDLLSTWTKDTKMLNFCLKLKKIIPFLFSILRFVEKKINLQQAFWEKIRSVVYTLILVAL